MSLSRTEYFRDLLEDCYTAARQCRIAPEDEATVVAAMIQSDSLNGLRKALLSALATQSLASDRRPQQP